MEQWKQVELHNGYEVSSYGRIRRGDKILKGVNQNGYRAVSLWLDGKRRYVKIHRLVATAFLGMDYYGPRNIVVMHLDNDKTNNHIDNLKVGRQRENCEYRSVDAVGVTQRGDGRWVAYIYDRGQKTFKTKEEAIEWRKNNLN